LPFPSR